MILTAVGMLGGAGSNLQMEKDIYQVDRIFGDGGNL
jgi:hypothetical protein